MSDFSITSNFTSFSSGITIANEPIIRTSSVSFGKKESDLSLVGDDATINIRNEEVIPMIKANDIYIGNSVISAGDTGNTTNPMNTTAFMDYYSLDENNIKSANQPMPYSISLTETLPVSGKYQVSINSSTSTKIISFQVLDEMGNQLMNGTSINIEKWLNKGTYTIIASSNQPLSNSDVDMAFVFSENKITNFEDLARELTNNLLYYADGQTFRLDDFNGDKWKPNGQLASSKRYTLMGAWRDVSMTVSKQNNSIYCINFKGIASVQVLGLVFTADLSNDKYLKVYWNSKTKSFMEQFDLKGDFTLKVEANDRRRNLDLGGFKFKNTQLTLSVDTKNEIYSFKTTVAIRRYLAKETQFNAEAKIDKDIYSVHVWISGVPVALGGNIYLKALDLNAKWSIAQDKPEKVYSGSLEMTYGKTYSLSFKYEDYFEFKGSYVLGELAFKPVTYSTSGYFYGKATLDVLKLNNYSLLHGEVEGGFGADGSFSVRGKVVLDLCFITVKGIAVITSLNDTITIASSLNLQTWAIFGGKTLFDAKFYLVSNTSDANNELSISVYGKIGGKEVGYRWDLLHGMHVCIGAEIADRQWKQIENEHDGLMEKIKYAIDHALEDENQAELHIETNSGDGLGYVVIESPDGQCHTVDRNSLVQTRGDEDTVVPFTLQERENGYSIALTCNQSGEWLVTLHGSDDFINNSNVSLSYYKTSDIDVSLAVTDCDAEGVSFSYSVSPNEAIASIYLMLDDDAQGYDGKYIASLTQNANGIYTWECPEGYENSSEYFYLMVQGEGFKTVYSDYTDAMAFAPQKCDIFVDDLQLFQNCYDSQQQVSLSFTIGNAGNEETQSFTSKVIISRDMIYDGDEYEVAFFSTNALSGNSAISDHVSFVIPDDYLTDSFYIGVVACTDNDYDEYDFENNITWLEFNASTPVASSNFGQLLTSRTWNQHTPWNDYCPLYPSDTTQRTIAGCGPIAAAQILYALKSPVSLSFDSSDAYTKAGISIDSNSGKLDFPSFTELNTALSSIKYDGSNEEMAMLAFAVGVKLQASYTVTGTSSWIPASFFTEDCGFDSAHWISTSSSATATFKNADGTFKQEYLDVIVQNVEQGSPVLLNIPNHFVFIEDYDRISNKFYINYGWGGANDGWYDLHDINGDCVEGIMLDIIPNYDGGAITVTSTDDYGVGTLRRAVELANSIKGANTIVIDPSLAGQTISLNSRLDITDQVTIVGLADSGVTINRNYDGYVFYLKSGSEGSRLSGMTIDGNAKSSYLIYNYSSNNTFENLKFQNSTGTYGLYSYYYAATVDASSDFNGYYTSGTIKYVPDAVTNTNAVGKSSSIDFSWDAVRDKEDGTVAKYRLEYSLSADMANATSVTVSGLSYRLGNVSAGRNYYWRVCGLDSNGNAGIYSDIQRTYTGTDAIAPTVVDGLAADVDDIRATLSWNDAEDSGSGISHYILEYAESNDFSNKTSVSAGTTTYKLSGLKNNAMYYWRVAAVDMEGNVGNYSQTGEFMPSADTLLISDDQIQTIETARKLHITETGSCRLDGGDLGNSTYAYLVIATGYETELYIDGDLALTDGRGGAYGIYGRNIVDGMVGGNISLNSDYEIPENGYAKTMYGLYSSNLRLSEFSSTLGISSDAGVNGYGLYAYDAFLRVNDFSGTISVDVEKGAYGIKAPRELYIAEFEESSSLAARSSASGAYGIYSYCYDDEYGLNESIRIDKLKGSISASSDSSYAYGIYSYYTNGGANVVDETISIDDWQGDVQVSGSSAYGVYNYSYVYQDATGDVSGKIDIGDMTGSLTVNGDYYSYGFYDGTGGLEISNMAGVVLASSEERAAYAFYSISNESLQASIAGTVIANSTYGSYAFYGNGGLDLSVSGTVLAGSYKADGETYESSSAMLKSYADERQDAGSDAKDKLKAVSRGYAFYSYGEKNDSISISDNALVVGNIALQGGNDTFSIDTTAEFAGNITTYGNLDLLFAFTGITDNATISTSSLSSILSANSTLAVDIRSNKSGKQTLIHTTSTYSSWGGKIIGLKVDEAVLPITVDGEAVTVGDKTVSLAWENSTDLVMYCVTKPRDVLGTIHGLSWFSSSDCVVEYSHDNFATTVAVETGTTGLDHYNIGAGTWQWRVRAKDGTVWSVGDDIVISSNGTEPTVVHGDANGVKDAFFVNPLGTWNSSYRARHMGVYGGWEGTGEKVVFGGENRFGDIFQGSTDENVLLLTDDANGDALFAYDIYTESKDDLAKYQARLANIKEIHAGAGNDIVDLTSDRFDYVGGGLSIHGGLGDDTIWSNKGDNRLFGDAGDDRIVGAGGDDVIVGGAGNDSMHGGGGDDVFAFGGAWGSDAVEQLADGKVTLWFDDGDESKWDASTLTYRDGGKSVKVSGVVASAVTLKFGDDGSEQYGKLLEAGAFDEFGSERIFENKNTRGMLA